MSASKFFNVIALNGSLRKHSIHAGLINEAIIALDGHASVSALEIGNLPFYNSDLEGNLPPKV